MLCEVSSRFLSICCGRYSFEVSTSLFFLLKESMGLDFHGSHQATLPLQFLCISMDLGPSFAESQPCWQWGCLVWIWLRLWLGKG